MTDRETVSRTAQNTSTISLKDSDLLARLDSSSESGNGPRFLPGFCLRCVVDVRLALPATHDVLAVDLAELPLTASALWAGLPRLVWSPSQPLICKVPMKAGGGAGKVLPVVGYVPEADLHNLGENQLLISRFRPKGVLAHLEKCSTERPSLAMAPDRLLVFPGQRVMAIEVAIISSRLWPLQADSGNVLPRKSLVKRALADPGHSRPCS